MSVLVEAMLDSGCHPRETQQWLRRPHISVLLEAVLLEAQRGCQGQSGIILGRGRSVIGEHTSVLLGQCWWRPGAASMVWRESA